MIFRSENKIASINNLFKALAILIVGIILTIYVTIYTKRSVEMNLKKDYEEVCKELNVKVFTRLQSQAEVLRAGSAFVEASDSVTRNEWKKFYDESNIRKELPGVLGFGYSMLISKNELQQHIQTTRKNGFPDYTVKPTGDRPFYTSIIYLEPFEGRNLRAFGYDMYSEPIRRKAMEYARDSDIVSLSGKVLLVQETNKDVQSGTLMYVPVFKKGMAVNTVEQRRAAIKGWVYSPHRMNDLMQGILGKWDLKIDGRIHLQIYDDSICKNNLLFDTQSEDSINHKDLSSRELMLPVNFNGTKWILFFTQPTVGNIYFYNKILVVFFSGIVISVLLFFLILSLLSTSQRANEIAEQLTSDLNQSREGFMLLLNSAAESIYGIDMNGNCTFTNISCIKTLGYEDFEQLHGKNMHDLIHHSCADGSAMNVKDCFIFKAFKEETRSHVVDEVLWRADGSCFPCEYWSYPLFIHGEIKGAVVTFIDITERKIIEEKLKEALNEAKKANFEKSEFLSRMSHELRTPMNSIIGFSQLLNMGELNPKQKIGINHILNSSTHLLSLINEVLDISGIEAGRTTFSYEAVKLNKMINEMIEIIMPQAVSLGIDVEFIDSPDNYMYISSDRLRLKQILLNLLNNAIKYNIENGKVVVKTEKLPPTIDNQNYIRISITNTGLGISKEEIPKLFNPFERLGNNDSRIEGTGLGLSIVKKLVEAMGGNIGVESIAGEETTFWFEFLYVEEVDIEEEVENNSIETIENSSNKGTILYIEDNIASFELVEEILLSERPNIKLLTDSLGVHTVQLAFKYSPNLILLDLDLPDIHGSEVLKQLQENNNTKDIPVVILSADAMPKQIKEMMNAGAKNYITKPLDIITFLNEIDKWVKRSA
ncbi:MAG: CHASE domain-containing protein [Bacteroidota bacterium]